MGNTTAGEAAQFKLDKPILEHLIAEYYQISGLSDKTHKGGWNKKELLWLLTVFSTKCSVVQKLVATEDPDAVTPATDIIPGQTKPGSHKKSFKKNKPDVEKISIAKFRIKKADAIKFIVVFDVPFTNFPLMTDQMWSLIDPTNCGSCTFTAYTEFLYYITRGSWEERMNVAFQFFDVSHQKIVRLEDITQLVGQIAEFIGIVARGLLNSREFISLKQAEIASFFEGTNGVLNLAQFCERSLSNHRLVNCYEILDMVFGRVVRKMEADLQEDRVFGRHLQEASLGNVKDVSGRMPFVPELLATAMNFLESHNALDTEGLFRLAPPDIEIKRFQDGLNAGSTLKSLLDQYQPVNSDLYILLGGLVKRYCKGLAEPVFTTQGAHQFMEAYDTHSRDEDKLIGRLRQLFNELPMPNQCFLSALIPFLRRVSEAQIMANPNSAMSDYNLGVVFAPCLIFDPSNPAFGVQGAPHLLRLMISRADLFVNAQLVQTQKVKNLRHQVHLLQLERAMLASKVAPTK